MDSAIVRLKPASSFDNRGKTGGNAQRHGGQPYTSKNYFGSENSEKTSKKCIHFFVKLNPYIDKFIKIVQNGCKMFV